MRRLDLSSTNLFLILIAFCVALGLWVVYRLRRDAIDDDGSTSEAEILKDLEEAYYAGEMDEAEFRRVTDAVKSKTTKPKLEAKIHFPVVLPDKPTVEETEREESP